ncbi:MAG: hypothetical protein A2583_15805 [Bdellovibrionales bacterium RIFOXYD1_FULL_53_11]|nr:MAG: hypothetical protein A2583_15805 [Bdellovibrionales bacterium RIFOXYD1_FULL_53_11]
MIWILEDDSSQQFIYREILECLYDIRFFKRFAEFENALATMKKNEPVPDLLVVDIRLPDKNLIHGGRLVMPMPYPFIIVSSFDQLDTMRECYKTGCRDYIIKPFKQNELLVAVERALQNTPSMPQESAKDIPAITLLADQCSVKREGGKTIELTRVQLSLFNFLYGNFGRYFSKEDIIRNVWNKCHIADDTFYVHLFNIREKLTQLSLVIDCKNSSFGLVDTSQDRKTKGPLRQAGGP